MSILSQVQGLPGMRAAKTVLSRMVTRGGWIPDILPTGKVLCGACTRDPGNTPDIGRIRAGMLLGKISTVVNSLGTVGAYAPSIIDVTAGAKLPGDTTVTISVAGATELSRRCGASGTFKLTGPGSAGGIVNTETVTYSALVVSTGVITVTALVNNYLAGSFVQPTDGSDTPITFVPSGAPIMATDFDGTNIEQEFGEVPIGCLVDSTMLLPVWPSEVSLQEWIVDRLTRLGSGKFTFNQRF